MEALWFFIIAGMLAVYVVLDGFDFGAGILHLCVARNDVERRTILKAIGPLWDGNEVWLLASGGILVYAFPKAYAAGFSGFYLPLVMALWLLVMRGVSIEFRSHEEHHLWRSFWDGVFWLSSTLMAIILGAALGNVIRGVPIAGSGYFSGPLFTDFRVGPNPGVLDWYTVLVGVFTLLALAAHGAMYLNWKTEGRVGRWIWLLVILVGAITTYATNVVRPELYRNLISRPWTWLFVFLIIGSLAAVFQSTAKRQELRGFLASSVFLAAMLGATAAGVYPTVLKSTLSETFSLTVFNAKSGDLGLQIGLFWWIPAIVLAIGYFVYLFRAFRGKVTKATEGHY
jgi:cytochrome d ubiquinol oxidase subunit II